MCDVLGYSRQAYYKQVRTQSEWVLKNQIIIESVHQIREHLPKTGTVKIWKECQKKWYNKGIKIGRDKTFNLLREQGLLQRKHRKKKPQTTMSNHWFKKYPDLIKENEFTRPNQLWVSDITYIDINSSWAYLFLITDAVSHKIVGHHLSNRIDTLAAIEALNKAIKTEKPNKELIHHSDRGIQYCSHAYTRVLGKHGINISMTQSGSPYDNAIAERINGILKHELIFPFGKLFTIEQAQKRINTAVRNYNSLRLHQSIGYKTPESVHKTVNP
jgi:transposase InsO family protein